MGPTWRITAQNTQYIEQTQRKKKRRRRRTVVFMGHSEHKPPIVSDNL
jgi:glyoxylase-like metal-dependent hydrolase (beta-lactamase superfamily II)